MLEDAIKETLVLGLGNLLMQDEGVGIEVINWLQSQVIPDEVELVDGGTGGFHLLGMFTGFKRVILIDAALNDELQGTVSCIKPRFAHDFPRVLSTHDIGLRDLLETASILESMPDIDLITISIKEFQEMGIGLTSQIMDAVPVAGAKVLELISRKAI
jgi:hydrogenase maturation protease